RPEVPGPEPAVGGDGLGVERRVAVADEAIGSAREDLSLVTGRHRRAALVDQAQLGGTDREALGLDPTGGRIVRAAGRDGRELGRAVDTLHDAAEPRGALPDEPRVHRRAAAGEEPEARRVAR